MNMGNPVNVKKSAIRDGDDVNWVVQRRRCSVDGRGLMEAIRERVELDVGRANEVLDQTPLKMTTIGDMGFQVVKARSPDYIDRVSFTRREDCSTAVEMRTGQSQHPVAFRIAPEWDEATASCRFTIKGEDVQLWQISQRALLPLLFPDASVDKPAFP